MSVLRWLFVFVAAAAFYFYLSRSGGSGLVGKTAPDFTLPGRTTFVTLSHFREKAVLVNFWASWCPPCVAEMPSLQILKQRLSEQPFEIVAVGVDEGGWGAMGQILKKQMWDLKFVWDREGAAASAYGVNQIPQSFLVDVRGMVVKSYEGPRDWASEEAVREILGYVNKN